MNKRSAGSFCSLVVSSALGAGADSVQSLLVVALGNGCEAYCTGNNSTYRWNAGSSQTTISDLCIVPISGGGCWFKQNAEADYTQQITGTSAFHGTSTVGLTLNTWAPLPSSTGLFAASFSSSVWSLNTSTGVWTYTGPPGLRFQVDSTLSFNNSSTQVFEFTVTKNAALLSTTTVDPGASASTLSGSGGFDTAVPNSVIISPAVNDNFQHVIRCVTVTPGTPLFSRYQVTLSLV